MLSKLQPDGRPELTRSIQVDAVLQELCRQGEAAHERLAARAPEGAGQRLIPAKIY